MNFEFSTSQRIIFESGSLKKLPGLARSLGRRPALVTGTSAERIMPLFRALKDAGIAPVALSISGEPTTDRIAALAKLAREKECDYVIAFGGGSVIDAGKAIAALLTNTGELIDYLEVIGNNQPLTQTPAPCIAIPTTAGTGAEVTRNAVLLSPEHNIKVSMRHPLMIPTIALVDPELTRSMSPEVTASTGLDALTQLIEAFTSKKSTVFTDAICRDAIPRAAAFLPKACTNGDDLTAREEMAYASLCGGLALANAGLGAVHGFAGPIGGMFKAPHGTICASLLPAVCTANITALKSRAPENPALQKYNELGKLLTGKDGTTADEAIQWITNLCTVLKTPGLASLGITTGNIPAIVEKGKAASSMKGNPIELTDEELSTILTASLPDSSTEAI